MQIRHIAAIGAVAAIVTTGALVLPGLAAQAAPGKGHITLQLVQSSAGSAEHNVVLLHGAITSGGKDVQKNDNDQFDTLHLKGGTLRVNHPKKDSKFSFKPDPKTCYFAFKGKGSFTLDHGTGKYRGVTGSGTYKNVGGGIAPKKKGSCDFNSNRGPYAGYVTGSGSVTLPSSRS